MNDRSQYVAGHASWVARAAPPPGIVLAREEGRLGVAAFVDVIRRSGLNRPIDDQDRMTMVLRNSNLVITARAAAAPGNLIGVARSVTDFAYSCYLSDLCVDRAWQRRGIGTALVAETKRIVGDGAMLLLLSAPDAMEYYPRIGMEPVANGFIIRRDR